MRACAGWLGRLHEWGCGRLLGMAVGCGLVPFTSACIGVQVRLRGCKRGLAMRVVYDPRLLGLSVGRMGTLRGCRRGLLSRLRVSTRFDLWLLGLMVSGSFVCCMSASAVE